MIKYLICLLLCFSSLLTSHGGAAVSIGDTLRAGESLNSSSFMVSASGEFIFGFYYGYFIVRFHNYSIWAANLYGPILDTSSAHLTLDKNKTLLQVTRGKTIMRILFSSPYISTNVVLSLTDSGNLVLQEVSNSSVQLRVLWQSSDEPNMSVMPGMKLSYGQINSNWQQLGIGTGVRSFYLDWDYVTHQLQIYNQLQTSSLVWSSGGLSSTGRFEFINIPDESNIKYSFSYDDQGYFSYVVVGDLDAKSAWVLLTNGELYDIYNNISIVQVGDCDGINTNGGCQSWGDMKNSSYCGYMLSSSNESVIMKQGFFNGTSLIKQEFMNSTTADWDSYHGVAGDCKATCWTNCNCLGFEFVFDNQTGCRYWSIEHSHFIEDPTSSTRGFILPRTPQPHITYGASHRRIWIGISIAIVLLALVLCSICYLIRRRKLAGENQKKIQDMLNMMNSNRLTYAHGPQNDGKRGHDLNVFKYSSIVAATCNFSDENKLGEGGFGPVYKGKLVTGEEVAVKKLSKRSGQGISEFKNELILIYELQHRNLVQLFGFCIHGEERMLIYEFLQNKSLDYILFDSTRCQQLDWKKRFFIIEGIAQGLLYLHIYSRTRIIHRDLKASNVLLDDMMNPKISDFGMARIFGNDEQEAKTMNIAGTRGYMSPEYIMGGKFSAKSDVFSFGVLMLEILRGRKTNSFYNDDRAMNLVGYAWALWKQDGGLALLDPAIGDSCDTEKSLRYIQVALLCVEESASDRPMMLDVIAMLTNESMLLPIPTKPAFCTENIYITTAIDGNGPEVVASVNDISISDFNGR